MNKKPILNEYLYVLQFEKVIIHIIVRKLYIWKLEILPHTFNEYVEQLKIYTRVGGIVFDNVFYFCSTEVTMKDSDYGSDDMIGTQQIELDDLDVDTEITKVLKVNKV